MGLRNPGVTGLGKGTPAMPLLLNVGLERVWQGEELIDADDGFTHKADKIDGVFIQCPCLIHNANGKKQRCNQKFKSTDGKSPSATTNGSKFMRHYTSEIHKNSDTPTQVQEWFPYACSTPMCRYRFRKDHFLQKHQVRCVEKRSQARLTARQSELQRRLLTDDSRTRRRKNRNMTLSTEGHPNNTEANLEQDTEQESESQNQLTDSTYDVFQQKHEKTDQPTQDTNSQMQPSQPENQSQESLNRTQSTQSTYNVFLQSSNPVADTHETHPQTQPRQSTPNDNFTNPFGFFASNEWDKTLSYWEGASMQRIPSQCIDALRDIVNETAEESSTGNKAAIRALKSIPRLLLSKTKGSRQKIAKTVTERIELWKARNFSQLWKDFQLHEQTMTYNESRTEQDKDDAREAAAYKRVEQAELSQAMADDPTEQRHLHGFA
jgi:hypothetical protein